MIKTAKHKVRGSTYTVLSEDFSLSTLSEEGSTHAFMHDSDLVEVEMQFSGEGKYGGPIVIYKSNEDGKYWLRPRFEFYDGRFEITEE